MKDINIRPLKNCEFHTAVELWNEARAADPITERVFKRKVVLDVNFNQEGYLIAECDGIPVGYIYVIIRLAPIDNEGDFPHDVADINAFGTVPSAPHGTAEALLEAAEEYARNKGIKKLLHSPYKPYYFTQGFDVERDAHYVKIFLDAGYKIQKESFARDIDLLNWYVSDELKVARKNAEAKGFYIGALKDELLLAFWEYMNKYSQASFRVRLRQLLRDTDDLARVRVVAYNGEVIGFNVFGDPDGSPERFGPFGLREEFRGLKLGQLLLADCLYEMKKRGLHNAWMQSTAKGTPADHVYDKAGFNITRTHVPMEKDI